MKEEKICSVINCQKTVKEGEFVKIGKKTYCVECAVLISESEVRKLMRGISIERNQV